MLVLSRKPAKDNDTVVIKCGETRIEVKVNTVKGDKVRLGFVAPDYVEVVRKEIEVKK